MSLQSSPVLNPEVQRGQIESTKLLLRYCKTMMGSGDDALVLGFADHRLRLRKELDSLLSTDKPEASAAVAVGGR